MDLADLAAYQEYDQSFMEGLTYEEAFAAIDAFYDSLDAAAEHDTELTSEVGTTSAARRQHDPLNESVISQQPGDANRTTVPLGTSKQNETTAPASDHSTNLPPNPSEAKGIFASSPPDNSTALSDPSSLALPSPRHNQAQDLSPPATASEARPQSDSPLPTFPDQHHSNPLTLLSNDDMTEPSAKAFAATTPDRRDSQQMLSTGTKRSLVDEMRKEEARYLDNKDEALLTRMGASLITSSPTKSMAIEQGIDDDKMDIDDEDKTAKNEHESDSEADAPSSPVSLRSRLKAVATNNDEPPLHSAVQSPIEAADENGRESSPAAEKPEAIPSKRKRASTPRKSTSQSKQGGKARMKRRKQSVAAESKAATETLQDQPQVDSKAEDGDRKDAVQPRLKTNAVGHKEVNSLLGAWSPIQISLRKTRAQEKEETERAPNAGQAAKARHQERKGS